MLLFWEFQIRLTFPSLVLQVNSVCRKWFGGMWLWWSHIGGCGVCEAFSVEVSQRVAKTRLRTPRLNATFPSSGKLPLDSLCQHLWKWLSIFPV